MIGAVILAAGESARLGRPKQLVEVAGGTLLRRTIDAAVGGGCRPVVVVLGAHAGQIEPRLAGSAAAVRLNEHWREGLSSSIRCGVEALADLADTARGVVLLVCDQPRIAPSVVAALIGTFDGAPGRMVACEYGGTVGVPAVFERACFPELLALTGDQGAKPVLLRHPERLVRLSWPAGADDVDTRLDSA